MGIVHKFEASPQASKQKNDFMPVFSPKEHDLLEGIRQGDTQALLHLYKTCYHSVERFVLQNSGKAEDAKDIFQEALMVVHEKLSEPHFLLSCSIKTFIYSVARRMWLKHLRERKQHSDIVEWENFIPLDEEDEQEWQIMQQNLKWMEEALRQLGSPCQEILEAYYFQQQSMQEIAHRFGYTNANNAKTQKYKCLQRLKRYFFQRYRTDLKE